MTRNQPGSKSKGRSKRGFQRTSALLQHQIRRVGESRGFAVSRLLTHWAEIVGTDTAQTALPVKVSYSQGGMGATLTVLTTGSNAPMLQADLPRIKDKVNACYGYAAIARIRITQTAPVGFAEGKVEFEHGSPKAPEPPTAEVVAKAQKLAGPVADENLRCALESLGKNIISRTNR